MPAPKGHIRTLPRSDIWRPQPGPFWNLWKTYIFPLYFLHFCPSPVGRHADCDIWCPQPGPDFCWPDHPSDMNLYVESKFRSTTTSQWLLPRASGAPYMRKWTYSWTCSLWSPSKMSFGQITCRAWANNLCVHHSSLLTLRAYQRCKTVCKMVCKMG